MLISVPYATTNVATSYDVVVAARACHEMTECDEPSGLRVCGKLVNEMHETDAFAKIARIQLTLGFTDKLEEFFGFKCVLGAVTDDMTAFQMADALMPRVVRSPYEWQCVNADVALYLGRTAYTHLERFEVVRMLCGQSCHFVTRSLQAELFGQSVDVTENNTKWKTLASCDLACAESVRPSVWLEERVREMQQRALAMVAASNAKKVEAVLNVGVWRNAASIRAKLCTEKGKQLTLADIEKALPPLPLYAQDTVPVDATEWLGRRPSCLLESYEAIWQMRNAPLLCADATRRCAAATFEMEYVALWTAPKPGRTICDEFASTVASIAV